MDSPKTDIFLRTLLTFSIACLVGELLLSKVSCHVFKVIAIFPVLHSDACKAKVRAVIVFKQWVPSACSKRHQAWLTHCKTEAVACL